MKRILIQCTAAILMATGILLGASWQQVDSGTWVATGPMNSARSGAATVLLQDGRILITGGNSTSVPSNSVELFAANGTFSLATPMNVPRSGHVAVVLQDGRVLVAGGMTSGGGVTNSAEIYDPTASTWTNVTGGMVDARSGHTAAVLHDGRVLIAGGQNGTLISSTIEIFDPSLGRFTAAGMMSSPRTQHAMTVLMDGRVLIVGGNKGTVPVGSTDLFDPVARTVSAGPSLSVARYGHSATTLLNGQVVVIGGNNGNANPGQMDVTPTEMFDPSAATPAFIRLASNLGTPREGHLAFLLPNNNNVLIVGGTSGGSTVASAELFTPQESSGGVWNYVFGSTGSLSTARSRTSGAANQVSSPSSVRQTNGVLLIAGGADENGNALKSSEAYGFATVQTDQGDYPPGTTVTITGSGWQPGETVQIQLVESPLLDTHGPYTVTADANGNISDRSFTTDAHDANVKFILTAVSSVSRAQTTFTDATVTFNNTNTAVAAFGKSSLSAPMNVTAGGSNTVAFATVWVDEGSGASGTTFNVTATYGGQAMTSAGATSYDYNYAPLSTQVFYLVNPPTGTNTLVVNATASSGTIQEVVANLVSYNGVNQTTPVRPGTYQTLHSATGVTVGSFTATISSNPSDLTLGAVEATYNFTSPASNQTVDGTNAVYYKVGGDHATTAASSISDTWNFTNPYAYYAYAGFSIQAASGGGTPTLTYTANPVSRSYGAANPAFTGTVTGFIGSDTQANSTTGTLTFSSTATSSSNVGSYAINGSGLTANNGKYTLAQAAGNATALTITKATPIVTVTGGTFTYDGNPHGATATAVGVDGLTAVSGSFSFTYTPPGNSTAPVNAGTYSVTASFTSSNPNYNNATGSGSITITTSVSAAVTFNNTNTAVAAFGKSSLSAPMSVTAGGSNTVAFATVWVDEGSGASGTTFNVTATYGGQAMTSAGATSYDYNYAPLSTQVFYLVNPPTGTNTLVVNATASSGTIQEVVANLRSFNGVNQTTPVRPGTYQTLHSATGVTVGSFTATISSNPSDLTLGAVEATYNFTSPASNQTVDGTNAVYYKVGGDHATTAASSISDTWNFTNPYAYYAYAGFSIQAASGGGTPTLTYTANPVSRSYGAANPAFTGTVTGFIGSDTQANSTTGTLTFSSTATSSSNVGSYAINGSGLTANNGKYTLAQAAGNATALTITKATPIVTVTGGTFTYDGNPHGATATAVGVDGITAVSGSFSFTYTPPGNSTVPVNAGTYSVTASFTSSNPNYNNATGSGSITITSSGTLTYTANPVSRSYGAANPAFTGTVTGFIGSDTQANSTTGTLTFSSTATSSSNVGSYAINGSGLSASSYTFVQAAGNTTALTITKATPIVTVTGGTFTYDGNPHGATATAVGVDGITAVSGSFSFTYTPPGNSTVPVNAGTYSVTASFTSSNPNYNNATGSGSITITTSVSAAVTFNNTNTAVAAFGKSSLSAPMSVTAGGSNTVAFATVWVDEGSGASGTTFNVTATYGGQAMTSAGATSYDYNYAPLSTQVFYLVNPPTGTNTLVVNATASSGTIQEVVANLRSFNGVNQTTPVRPGTYQTLHSATGVTVGSFTATISSNPSDLTLGAVEATYNFTSPASNQTVDGTNAVYYKVGGDHATTAASSISDTWNFTNPYAYYAYAGFSIQAASGGGTPTLTYTANPVSRSYGAANPAFTGTVTGFIGSDTQANSTTGTLTFSSTATSSSNVGSYAINGSGLTANNGKYNFVQAAGNATALTITPATATVYYLAPAANGGSDFNNGLSPSAPWLTPKHAVNCGDVIIAAPSSSYSGTNFTAGRWGTVTCAGGNNVAWLKCATFDACKITSTPSGSIWIDKPYWGVQGWEVNGSNNGNCFAASPSPSNPVEVHHVIFANDVATGCGTASFGSTNLFQSTTASADYIAIVGTISYNTASGPTICGEGITVYQPILSDSNPGTHFFIAGNFAWDNVNAITCNGGHPQDGEGIILDTFNGIAGGITPYAGQTVVENNIVLFNGARGIQVVQNSAGTIYFRQNTIYGNNTDVTQGGACTELLVNTDTTPTYVTNNIAMTTAATTCNGSTWWAYLEINSSTALQISSGSAYSAAGHTCGNIGGTFSCSGATLTTTNPSFASPSNPGAPSCGSFSSVPACMATVIANFTPTNPSVASYGYQIPSATPTFDPLFPQWVCNVNLPPGLVTMGCN